MSRDFANNYVYVLYSISGEPFYVGIGAITKRMKLGFRIQEHVAETKRYINGKIRSGGNEAKLKIIREILEHNVTIPYQIVARDVSRQEANYLEKSLIDTIGRKDLGFGPLTNKNNGGSGSSAPSDETRAKISQANKGKIVSPETREKQSKTLKGRIITPEWRENISKGSKGKPHSLEHNEKVAAKNRQRCSTPEHAQMVSESSRRQWIVLLPNEDSIIVEHLPTFAKENNLNYVSLSQSGRKMTFHKGYQATKIT